ncbi:MAG: cytochrome c class I [Aequorivita sp.]|jgi:mono/diheme cytochrome c family protein|nr:cytochrome c class I [Aequorivita sp.]|tara:strand:- start:9886 stop:10317 length:432 start_codon:yes stop_codon:yes gene_type:complete
MKTKKILVSTIFASLIYVLFVSFTHNPKDEYEALQQKKWVAPASADKIVNPLKGDATAAASGKKTYKMLCFVCHGPKGKGDGMGGAGLTPKPTDLTTEEFQSQSDGAIFWKITEGRAPMASYKTSIPEKKRWELVNYLRTLQQ